MGCAGCGRRYRKPGAASVNRTPLPVKYQKVEKPKKQPPVAAPATPKKMDPQIAIGVMSSIANNISK
jgi:hypothetical protein